MAIDLGRVVGPQGERGTRWHFGTGLSGESINNVECASGTAEFEVPALAGDIYLNTISGEFYLCVHPGDVSVAKWTYAGIIKGKAFEYSDFTSSQLESLKVKGDKGDRGPAFSFDGTGPYSGLVQSGTAEYASLSSGYTYLVTDGQYAGKAFVKDVLASGLVLGYASFDFKGDRGDQGETGVGISSVTEIISNESEGANVITFHFTDNTSSSVTVKNGAQGDPMRFEDLSEAQVSAIMGPRGFSVSAVQCASSVQDGGLNNVSILLDNGAVAGQFSIRNGSRGSRWFHGTGLEGTGSNLSLAETDGFTGLAQIGDIYQNDETCAFYHCSVAGDKSQSKWDYGGSAKGQDGQPGVPADAKGDFAGRDSYDLEAEGFTYFDTENVCFYIHGAEQSSWSDPITIRGENGERGETGAYFYPIISPNGMISWTNNGGYTNPSPVNLRQAGTNIVISPVPPSRPYRGLVWIQASNEERTAEISAFNTIRSATRPVSPENGDIWIKE